MFFLPPGTHPSQALKPSITIYLTSFILFLFPPIPLPSGNQHRAIATVFKM